MKNFTRVCIVAMVQSFLLASHAWSADTSEATSDPFDGVWQVHAVVRDDKQLYSADEAGEDEPERFLVFTDGFLYIWRGPSIMKGAYEVQGDAGRATVVVHQESYSRTYVDYDGTYDAPSLRRLEYSAEINGDALRFEHDGKVRHCLRVASGEQYRATVGQAYESAVQEKLAKRRPNEPSPMQAILGRLPVLDALEVEATNDNAAVMRHFERIRDAADAQAETRAVAALVKWADDHGRVDYIGVSLGAGCPALDDTDIAALATIQGLPLRLWACCEDGEKDDGARGLRPALHVDVVLNQADSTKRLIPLGVLHDYGLLRELPKRGTKGDARRAAKAEHFADYCRWFVRLEGQPASDSAASAPADAGVNEAASLEGQEGADADTIANARHLLAIGLDVTIRLPGSQRDLIREELMAMSRWPAGASVEIHWTGQQGRKEIEGGTALINSRVPGLELVAFARALNVRHIAEFAPPGVRAQLATPENPNSGSSPSP